MAYVGESKSLGLETCSGSRIWNGNNFKMTRHVILGYVILLKK